MEIIYATIITFSVILLVTIIDFMDILKNIIALIVTSFMFYELSLNLDNQIFSLTFLYLSVIVIFLIPIIVLIYYINKLQKGKSEE